MSNKRKHPRIPIGVKILLTHTSFGEKLVKTKNISDGGVFVLVEPNEVLHVGEVITGQVQGMMDDPPMLEMRVVRVAGEGLGLEYVA